MNKFNFIDALQLNALIMLLTVMLIAIHALATHTITPQTYKLILITCIMTASVIAVTEYVRTTRKVVI